MKIHNLRLGFATNSSSTHSIVLLSRGQKPPRTTESLDFGWDHWTAASREDKLNYVTLTLASAAYQKTRDTTIVRRMVSKWLGEEVDLDMLENGYIDHQSRVLMPNTFNGKLNKPYMKAWARTVLSDRVVILGGNDNGESEHPFLSCGLDITDRLSPIRDHAYPHDIVARHEGGDEWVVFDRENGTKIRVRLSTDLDSPAPRRAKYPELVDIKITDKCHLPPQCAAYCYQSSGPKGKEANWSDLERLAKDLGNHEVFEVAIGGGEPTLSPNFLPFLRACRAMGVVPNFTTRHKGWLVGPDCEEIMGLCGGFAASVSSKAEVVEWCDAVANPNKMSFQVVMGTIPMEELIDIIRFVDDELWNGRVTLLGYKSHGRGVKITPPYDYSNWLGTIRKELGRNVCSIGIDTALAESSVDQLKSHGVSGILYSIHEGTHSMYIDAVRGVFAPSSYCDKSAERDITDGMSIGYMWNQINSEGV